MSEEQPGGEFIPAEPSDDSVQDDEAMSGTWFVMSPDEVMVTFYIPLPEPIGLPAGTPFLSVDLLDQTAISILDHSKVEFLLGKRLTQGGYELYTFPEEFGSKTPESNSGRPLYWGNKHLISSSILVHQASVNFLAKTSLDTAFSVADAASRGSMSIGDIATLAESRRRSSSPDLMSDLEDLGAATILECNVGLRISASSSDETSKLAGYMVENSEITHPIESDTANPLNSSYWSWYRLGENHRSSTYSLVRRVQAALDIALAMCRTIQQSYYVATSRPVTLITRSRLPFVLPASIRRFSDISEPNATPLTIVPTNSNMHGLAKPEYVESVDRIHQISAQISTAPLAAHADLEREARAAYDLQGDMRATAIFAAISAETFLDEILLHLLWEEVTTPEVAAANWRDKLANHIKAEFSIRLGGSWDLTLNNPVGNWYRYTADLRNRVVHAAYLPSTEEAELALKSLRKLVNYVGELLSKPSNVRKYPRTSISLLGNDEMDRRGVRSKHILSLQSDENEPNWRETFSRWIACWRRIRRDMNGTPRIPQVLGAYLLAVIKRTGEIDWCLHDRTSAVALQVRVDQSTLNETLRTQLSTIIAHNKPADDNERISISSL